MHLIASIAGFGVFVLLFDDVVVAMKSAVVGHDKPTSAGACPSVVTLSPINIFSIATLRDRTLRCLPVYMLARQTFISRGTASLFRSPRAPFAHPRFFSATLPAMSDNTSGVTAESLKQALTTKLDAQHVEIQDLSGMVYPASKGN